MNSNSNSFSMSDENSVKITYFDDIGIMQTTKKESLSSKDEERNKRRKELKQEVYNESNCWEKMEINLRNFLCWLIYNEHDP